MAKAKSSAAQPETGSPNGLRITSAREGFRRAGRVWSMAPTEVLLDELSEDEIALLRAETMLTVEEITLP